MYITWFNFSVLIPSSSKIYPPESDNVKTVAPNSIAFSAANCATFPEPEITTLFPLKESALRFNIF